MNRKVRKILKETGMTKDFILVMILRAPFDFINALLSANMLETFIRLAERKEEGELLPTFGMFLLFTVIMFGYNMFVWAVVTMRLWQLFLTRVLLHSQVVQVPQRLLLRLVVMLRTLQVRLPIP